MNKKDSSKVAMYKRVLSILEENEANWIDKPAYVSAWSSITDNLGEIKMHIELKDDPISGNSTQKQHAREKMIKLAHESSTLITAFALTHDDQNLIARNGSSLSTLKIMREANLELHMVRVLKDIDQYHHELSDYGITLEIRDAIAASFNEWKDLVVIPRKVINDRKKEGFAIQQLIKIGDKLLRNTLDKLMIPFQTTHPNFYFDYRSARMILEAGNHPNDEAPSTSDPF